ncbi:alpha/beta hydrolase [Candidatus Auribacterota bacterium]
MIYLKIIFKLLFFSGIFVVFVSGFMFFTSIRPPRFVSPWTPEDFMMKFEDVTLQTSDGVSIKAWYIPRGDDPASKKAVVLCHGYPADKGNIISIAEMLHPHFNLLMFDFRAMGKSGGKVTTIGHREVNDLNAAVDWLKARGITSIGAYGFSMGGAVAIMAENPSISAIVSESAYADLNLMLDQIYGKFSIFKYPFILMTNIYARLFLGVDLGRSSPRKSISRLGIPVFLIHSERDSQIPVEHVAILKKEKPDAEIWVIEGGDHGQLLDKSMYKERMVKFFSDNL